MKRHILLIISFLAVYSILSFLVNPLFAIAFCFPIPVVFGLTYFILKRQNNLIREPIESTSGYQIRIMLLKKVAEKASMLGFKENYVTRLNTPVIPSIICQFKHEKESYFLTACHYGIKIILCFSTYFEPDLSLITCSDSETGNLPPLPGEHIRVLETENLENLYEEHLKGVEFFKQNSYKEKDLTLEEFTDLYISTLKNVAKNVMRMKYWLFKATWWMLIERGKMYRKSIQEQMQSGMVKLE